MSLGWRHLILNALRKDGSGVYRLSTRFLTLSSEFHFESPRFNGGEFSKGQKLYEMRSVNCLRIQPLWSRLHERMSFPSAS